jgi:hypothetical protein
VQLGLTVQQPLVLLLQRLQLAGQVLALLAGCLQQQLILLLTLLQQLQGLLQLQLLLMDHLLQDSGRSLCIANIINCASCSSSSTQHSTAAGSSS